jgi:hypothetical protein
MMRDRGREGNSNVSYSEGVMMNQRGVWYFQKRSNQVKSGGTSYPNCATYILLQEGLYISKKGKHRVDKAHMYALSKWYSSGC